ncbi:class I SAM-dependent methyltransferase [Kordiimonas sp.]|uniref:class I SAM-dependent methyltransferase n=1 Tax=Kordiimonas sp. TaxID=1970157 RepID=UPI003A934090
MSATAKFWNRMAKGYAKSSIADQASYEHKLELTRSYFTPETEVVEIACGTGSTALLHAPHVKHILATDISENMLAIAREKAATQNITNVTFECTPLEDLTVPDGSVDMVMAHSILHLLPKPEAAIAQAHRMLKPGGLFVSSTVCLQDGLGFFKYILPIARAIGYAPPHVGFMKGTELTAMIEQAGFSLEHNWRPAPKKAVFIIARKKKP